MKHSLQKGMMFSNEMRLEVIGTVEEITELIKLLEKKFKSKCYETRWFEEKK